MKENKNGSDTGLRNDGHHGSEPELSISSFSSTKNGKDKDSELIDFEARFKPSQREIDLYYFYYSSRL
jgi:hypothetical protein